MINDVTIDKVCWLYYISIHMSNALHYSSGRDGRSIMEGPSWRRSQGSNMTVGMNPTGNGGDGRGFRHSLSVRILVIYHVLLVGFSTGG